MAEEFGKELEPDAQQAQAGEREQPSDLFYWLHALVTALVCLMLVFTFFGRLTRVDGHSMDNTLEHNELLLVWSLGYSPKQGDIVIVNKTTAQARSVLHGEAIVKRVIATGGQTVDIDYDTSTVYVDGQALDEPYIKEAMDWPFSSRMQGTHFEVPEGSIFVMGDNRNDSDDSRDEMVGSIDEGYILGRAAVAIWPLNRIGLL